ncbi:MAG: hypothetical protein ACE5IP_01450 [Terriglobia bacterium]
MKRHALTFGLILFGLNLVAGAQTPQETKPRRAVVTFDGKLEALPPLAPGDFEIQAGKQKLAPTRLYDPDDLPTVLAIVLQENITSEFATQLPALRKFILNQPPNTYIVLVYLSASQNIDQPVPPNAPRQKIADAVRAPKAMKELAPPNPYEPLARIMNYMYKMPDARKEILLFSEGTDALSDTAGAGQNRNVRRALEMAHQTGIPVWVVYTRAIPPERRLQNIDESPLGSGSQIPGPSAPAAGPQDSTTAGQASAADRVFGGGAGGGGSFGGTQSTGGTSFSGRPLAPPVQYGLNYLKYLSERSGGKMLSSGKFAADITPYLDEFERLLRQQYVLEFSAEESPKKIKVKRKIRGAKLRHPRR